MNLSRSRLARLLLLLPALALVGACGAFSTNSADDSEPSSIVDSGTTAGTARDSGAAAEPEAAHAGQGDLKVADAAGVREAPAPAETKAVISKGQISLHTSDVDETRFDLQKLLDGWNGEIASEQSSADKDGDTDRQRLELRVPSEHFDTAMTELSELGTLVDRTRTSEDVTTQVIDNEVRVRTQKASILRIQALLAQATTINQVISIEQQLSQRQAELDSLEQQQKYLADQTSLSTITVYLSVPGKGAASGEENGFIAGLKAGWEQLGETTTVVLTALGAILPFAALIALIGTPLWLARRRSRAAVSES